MQLRPINYVSPLTDGDKASTALACTISEIQSTKPAAKFCQLCVNSTANPRESECISTQGGREGFHPAPLCGRGTVVGRCARNDSESGCTPGPPNGNTFAAREGAYGRSARIVICKHGGSRRRSVRLAHDSDPIADPADVGPTTTWGLIQKHVQKHVGSVFFTDDHSRHRRTYKARRGCAPRAVQTPLSRPPA